MRRACVRSPFSDVSLLVTLDTELARKPTKDDKETAQSRRHCPTAHRLQGEEHGRGKKDAADSREHAHGNVGHARLDVVLPNLLEVEIAVKAGKPAREGNQHLGEWWMYIHEKLPLDVFGRKATEMDFIEHHTRRLIDAEKADNGRDYRQP
jgi:hypothetical protein